MLIAQTPDKVRVYAEVASKEEQHRCPMCDGEVTLKKGQIVRPHFAHKPQDQCEWGGESADHLEMKHWFLQALFCAPWVKSVEPEVRIQNMRADVLVESHSGRKIAIECQVSDLPAERVKEKTQLYAREGIECLYVIHQSGIKLPKGRTFQQFPHLVGREVILSNWSQAVWDISPNAQWGEGFAYYWSPAGLHLTLREPIVRERRWENPYGKIKTSTDVLTTKFEISSAHLISSLGLEWESVLLPGGVRTPVILPHGRALDKAQVKVLLGEKVLPFIRLSRDVRQNNALIERINQVLSENPGPDTLFVEEESPSGEFLPRESSRKVSLSSRLITMMRIALAKHNAEGLFDLRKPAPVASQTLETDAQKTKYAIW